MTRRQTVIELLKTLTEVREPLGPAGSESRAGHDSRLLLMTPEYTEGTYAELERCLKLMREKEPVWHWHVSERYIRSVSKPEDVIVSERRKSGKRVKVKQRQVVERWHAKVDVCRVCRGSACCKVQRGVSWILAHHRGKPRLPKEIERLVAA